MKIKSMNVNKMKNSQKKDNNLFLKVITTINGVLLIGIGLYIVIKSIQNKNYLLVIFGIVPIIIGIIIIGYSFIVLSEANKSSVRTCDSGTILKISHPSLFKIRGFMIDHMIEYYEMKKETLYIDSKARRLVIKVEPKEYMVVSFNDIDSCNLEVNNVDINCLNIRLTIKGLHFEKTFELIKKSIKITSNKYLQKIKEGELIKSILSNNSPS